MTTATPPRWVRRTLKEEAQVAAHLSNLVQKLHQSPLCTFSSNIDGVPILYRAVTPPASTSNNDATATTLLILTGYNETIDKYCEFIDEMSSRINSLHVFIMDHRGQGISGRESTVEATPLLAHATDWRHWVRDVEQFVSQVIQPTGKNKLHIFAHSMGGMIATHVAAANPSMFATVSLNCPLYKITMGNPMLEKINFLSPFARLMVFLGYDKTNSRGDLHIKPNLKKWGYMEMSADYERTKFWHQLRVKSVTTDNGRPGVVMSPSFGWFNQVTNCCNELDKVVSQIISPVIIIQAEKDVLVSNLQHHKLAAKMQNALVLQTGHNSFHEQHYAGRDVVRKMILDVVTKNITFLKIELFPSHYMVNPSLRSLSSYPNSISKELQQQQQEQQQQQNSQDGPEQEQQEQYFITWGVAAIKRLCCCQRKIKQKPQ